VKERWRCVAAEVRVRASDRLSASIAGELGDGIDSHKRRARGGRTAQRVIVKGPMLRVTGITRRRRCSNHKGLPGRAALNRGRAMRKARQQHKRHGQAQRAPEPLSTLPDGTDRTTEPQRCVTATMEICSGHPDNAAGKSQGCL
jgi:hypothetical protein